MHVPLRVGAGIHVRSLFASEQCRSHVLCRRDRMNDIATLQEAHDLLVLVRIGRNVPLPDLALTSPGLSVLDCRLPGPIPVLCLGTDSGYTLRYTFFLVLEAAKLCEECYGCKSSVYDLTMLHTFALFRARPDVRHQIHVQKAVHSKPLHSPQPQLFRAIPAQIKIKESRVKPCFDQELVHGGTNVLVEKNRNSESLSCLMSPLRASMIHSGETKTVCSKIERLTPSFVFASTDATSPKYLITPSSLSSFVEISRFTSLTCRTPKIEKMQCHHREQKKLHLQIRCVAAITRITPLQA